MIKVVQRAAALPAVSFRATCSSLMSLASAVILSLAELHPSQFSGGLSFIVLHRAASADLRTLHHAAYYLARQDPVVQQIAVLGTSPAWSETLQRIEPLARLDAKP